VEPLVHAIEVQTTQPSLRVVLAESEIVGFGASGVSRLNRPGPLAAIRTDDK
jgi:hypothetical protein